MNWSEREPDMPEHVEVTYADLGAGFVEHNLRCFICNKRPAMWWGNPVWMFAPCSKCREAAGVMTFEDACKAKRCRWWQRTNPRRVLPQHRDERE